MPDLKKTLKSSLRKKKKESLLTDILIHANTLPESNKSKKSRSYKDKASKNKRSKLLSNFKWGLGLEHEVHIFHRPHYDNKEKIQNFIVFDSDSAITEIIDKYLKSNNSKISATDKEFIEKIPFELSGRKCAGEWVLKRLNTRMPEFVTNQPFARKPVEFYCSQIIEQEYRFLRILDTLPRVKRQREIYGALAGFPMGTCSYIKEPIRKVSQKIKYEFNKDKSGKEKTQTDYTGSYHLTITLPFDDNTKEKEFLKMHQNFANMLQWIEPLLIIGFFSCDPRAMGTKLERVRGSFRVMRVGWGNLAGSDVRKFNEGIGRYSDIKTYWREGLKFHNLSKLKACDRATFRDEPGAISGLSSNIRTFGSTDPLRPWHRESGAPMNKPNGIEIRIFDSFNPVYLPELCKFIVYLAENSRNHECQDYVYQDKDWIEALQEIMIKGWKAELPKKYVDKLRKNLGLSLKPASLRGCDVLDEVNEKLFKQNRKGDWSFLMLEREYDDAPKIPHINRKSWEMAFFIRLNREETLLEKFNRFIYSIPSNERITFAHFSKLLFKYFPKNLWGKNVEDIAYLLETHSIIRIYIKNNKIDSIKFLKPDSWRYDNVNMEILSYWNDPSLFENDESKKFFENNLS